MGGKERGRAAERGASLRREAPYTATWHSMSARATSHLVLAADFHLIKLCVAVRFALHTGRLHVRNERDAAVRGAAGELCRVYAASTRRFRGWHAKKAVIVRSLRGDTMAAFGAARAAPGAREILAGDVARKRKKKLFLFVRDTSLQCGTQGRWLATQGLLEMPEGGQLGVTKVGESDTGGAHCAAGLRQPTFATSRSAVVSACANI